MKDKDSVLMFRGQRLSARETQLARHAYRMAVGDMAHGPLIGDVAAERFPLPEESIAMPGDVSFIPATRTYSEREVIYREREAFENGLIRGTAREFDGPGGGMPALKRAVAKAFPLPKVTRPRVVSDPFGNRFRWTSDYGLQTSDRLSGVDRWEPYHYPIGEPLRLVIADLLANPTEEVEAE